MPRPRPSGSSSSSRGSRSPTSRGRRRRWRRRGARPRSSCATRDRRAKALEEIRAALQSDDDVSVLGALRAVAQIGTLKYDKAAVPAAGPAARRRRGEPEVRAAAFYALYNTVVEPDDLRLVLDRIAKGDRQDAMSHLVVLSRRASSPATPAGATATPLTTREHGRTCARCSRGMWGASVSAELEAEVPCGSRREPETRDDAIYFAVSTLREKSRRSCRGADTAAGDPDPDVWQRALWGLSHGVAEAERGEGRERDGGRARDEERPGRRSEYALRALGENGRRSRRRGWSGWRRTRGWRRRGERARRWSGLGRGWRRRRSGSAGARRERRLVARRRDQGPEARTRRRRGGSRTRACAGASAPCSRRPRCVGLRGRGHPPSRSRVGLRARAPAPPHPVAGGAPRR